MKRVILYLVVLVLFSVGVIAPPAAPLQLNINMLIEGANGYYNPNTKENNQGMDGSCAQGFDECNALSSYLNDQKIFINNRIQVESGTLSGVLIYKNGMNCQSILMPSGWIILEQTSEYFLYWYTPGASSGPIPLDFAINCEPDQGGFLVLDEFISYCRECPIGFLCKDIERFAPEFTVLGVVLTVAVVVGFVYFRNTKGVKKK